MNQSRTATLAPATLYSVTAAIARTVRWEREA